MIIGDDNVCGDFEDGIVQSPQGAIELALFQVVIASKFQNNSEFHSAQCQNFEELIKGGYLKGFDAQIAQGCNYRAPPRSRHRDLSEISRKQMSA